MSTRLSNASAARMTIAFCVVTALCEGIDLQAAGVAALGIGAEFQPSADEFGTFFSASTFGLFLGALFGGRIADSVGRKKVLVTSVAFFGIFSLFNALAPDMQWFIWIRFLTGLGLGGALPMFLALVTESSGAGRHDSSVAMVYAATPFGGAIISLISLLITPSQWRVIFIVGGILPILLAPIMAVWLKESSAFQRVRSTISANDGAALSAMPKRGSFKAIFTDDRAPRTVLLWVSFFLGLLLLYLLLNWLPTLMVSHGLTRMQAAGAQIGFNVGGGLAALLIGYLLAGRYRNAGIVVTFVTLPILLVALAKAPRELGAIVITVFLLGCSVIAAQAVLYSMAPITYPTTIRGIGVGAAVAFGRLGSIVGPKLAGFLKAAGHGPSQLFMDLLPLVIVGSACALVLAWFTRRATARDFKAGD